MYYMEDIKTEPSNKLNKEQEAVSNSNSQEDVEVQNDSEHTAKNVSKPHADNNATAEMIKEEGSSSEAELDNSETKQEEAEVDELAKIITELNNSQDQNLRLQAEIQNMHKRFFQDLAKARVSGLLDIAPVMLETLDNLEKALGFYTPDGDASQLSDNEKSIQHGVDLTYKTLIEGLNKFGLEEINPQEDEEFNPEYHEALAQVKLKGKSKGMVIAVIQKGYMMHNRLLRAAKVQVTE